MKYKAKVNCTSNGRFCHEGEIYEFDKAESKYLVPLSEAKKLEKKEVEKPKLINEDVQALSQMVHKPKVEVGMMAKKKPASRKKK